MKTTVYSSFSGRRSTVAPVPLSPAALRAAQKALAEGPDFGAIVRERMKLKNCTKAEAIKWAVKTCPEAHARFVALPADKQNL